MLRINSFVSVLRLSLICACVTALVFSGVTTASADDDKDTLVRQKELTGRWKIHSEGDKTATKKYIDFGFEEGKFIGTYKNVGEKTIIIPLKDISFGKPVLPPTPMDRRQALQGQLQQERSQWFQLLDQQLQDVELELQNKPRNKQELIQKQQELTQKREALEKKWQLHSRESKQQLERTIEKEMEKQKQIAPQKPNPQQRFQILQQQQQQGAPHYHDDWRLNFDIPNASDPNMTIKLIFGLPERGENQSLVQGLSSYVKDNHKGTRYTSVTLQRIISK